MNLAPNGNRLYSKTAAYYIREARIRKLCKELGCDWHEPRWMPYWMHKQCKRCGAAMCDAKLTLLVGVDGEADD